MNRKPVLVVAAATVSAWSLAGNLLGYQITVGPNDSLTDAYQIEYDATSLFVTVSPVNTENVGAVFPAGTVLDGVFDTGNTPTTDKIFLNVVGVFTDATETNVAMSFPAAIGNTLITDGATWDELNAGYFHDILPSESTALGYLQSGSSGEVYNIANAFYGQPPSSPILQTPGTAGVIVDFDGATNGGGFSYQAVPEPASCWGLALGALGLIRRRRRAVRRVGE